MRLPKGFTGLMVATPCYGGVVTNAFMLSSLRAALLMQAGQVVYEVVTSPGDSLVHRARNTLAAVFLASRHSHLLFVDADIGFPADGPLRLLNADRDLVCGIYPKKCDEPEFPLNWLPGSSRLLERCPRTGCVRILEGPTGFMMIHRRVFERMMEAHPEWRYRGPAHLTAEQEPFSYSFFDCFHHGERYLSEDYGLCARWAELGGETWMDPSIRLTHVGQKTYDAQIASMLEPVYEPESEAA